MEHEATTSKVDDDQLFYCRQRGMDEEEAVALVVNGFCKEVLQALPMEFAVEAQKLVAISLEGSRGVIAQTRKAGKRITAAVLTSCLVGSLAFASTPMSSTPNWGATGVPMQAKGPLLEGLNCFCLCGNFRAFK